VSYTSIFLWVETICIPCAGRRTEFLYVTTDIAYQWDWKLGSNEVAYKMIQSTLLTNTMIQDANAGIFARSARIKLRLN